MGPDTSIRELKGIGDKTEKLFAKLGVFTLGDILLRFPNNYVNYPEVTALTDAQVDTFCTIQGTIHSPVYVRAVNGMKLTTTTIMEENRKLSLVWYRKPFLKNSLHFNETYLFFGKLKKKNAMYSMEQSVIFSPEQYHQMRCSLQPVYSLTAGLTNKLHQKCVENAFRYCQQLEDTLPPFLVEKYCFPDYTQALYTMHFPENEEELQNARKRLIYEEFYHFLLQLESLKKDKIQLYNQFQFKDLEPVLSLLKDLPYALTMGQHNALHDVLLDMKKPIPMMRLLQGDVGCGKTIIAFLAMIYASLNGYQSALMVPTEVLAGQHYVSFSELAQRLHLNMKLFLLTGSMSVKDKRNIKNEILNTPGALVLGTHALIQEDVQFESLALVITDEQHRFGVRQRESLGKKGNFPHILVMSATPIPRTLAIILYGDLSISKIQELPASRKPIKNCVVDKKYYRKSLEFIEEQVQCGYQAYVICPLVEESEAVDAEDVQHCTEMLTEFYKGRYKIASLHGKMKAMEKEKVMKEFAGNEIQILVSTTVVEVGVNVPNATVMLILNAERFGLAQLHQLRGRVGRSSAQSYCILMNGDSKGKEQERLTILNHSNDGFEIAEQDLLLRGPGDFFGIRQSGEMNFCLGDIYRDNSLLQLAADDINEQKRKGEIK
ncbi:MAG: ATP-dependent DNA helicase RecG [Lachnospiraceae bacterium]